MGAISAHLLWGVRPALSLSSPHRPQSQELFGGNKCTSVTSISWEERSVCWMCPAWISDCSGSAGSFSEAPENGPVHCGPHQCFFSSISWFSSFLCCWEGTSKKPLTQSRITPSPDQSPLAVFLSTEDPCPALSDPNKESVGGGTRKFLWLLQCNGMSLQ